MSRRLILLTAFMAAAPGLAWAGDHLYRLAPDATSVTFTTGAFGVARTTGRVAVVDGTLTFNPAHPGDSEVAVSLDMTTLSTGVAMFDGQLQGDAYFDTANYPRASFRSTQVEMTGQHTAKVTGDMTLHGVTRPVTMAVTFDARAGEELGFTATAQIDRRDFGIDKFQLFISDDIDVRVEAKALP